MTWWYLSSSSRLLPRITPVARPTMSRMMLRICRGAWMKRTRLAVGRYSVSAKPGNRIKKSMDMMTPCAARAPFFGPPLVDEDELVEDDDPDEVAIGTMLVTDAVPDCETVVRDTEPEPELAAAVDPADPAAVVAEELPALLLLPDDATKGFEELPPAASAKLKLMFPIVLCCERLWPRSVESTGEPVLMAQIQLLLLSVGDMLPPDHELQPSQRMFAVIDPSELELEPLSTVMEVAVLAS